MACAHCSMGLISAGEGASRMWAVGVYERAGCSARQALVAGAGCWRRQVRTTTPSESTRRLRAQVPAQAADVRPRRAQAGTSTCQDCRRQAALQPFVAQHTVPTTWRLQSSSLLPVFPSICYHHQYLLDHYYYIHYYTVITTLLHVIMVIIASLLLITMYVIMLLLLIIAYVITSLLPIIANSLLPIIMVIMESLSIVITRSVMGKNGLGNLEMH